MGNQAAIMETDSSQTSWLHAPNYQANSQRREKICWQSLFFKGEGGVESVKHLYLVEHKSSQELCIIMINISLILRLDTEISSHSDLNKGNAKCPVIEQFFIILTWIKCSIKCLSQGYAEKFHHTSCGAQFISDRCSEKSLGCMSEFVMMAQEHGGKVT